MGEAGALEWAEVAVGLVRDDPARAEALARRALAEASGDGQPEATATATALRVLGMVARDRQAIAEAELHFRAAVDHAERAGRVDLAAACRMSLAGALIFRGGGDEALVLLDRSVGDLQGVERARARFQRAAVLQVMGRDDEALAAYEVAARALRRVGDRFTAAQLHNNRGLLHFERGRLAEADDDLCRAERLYDELGMGKATADVRTHLGALASRRGDLPAALRWYDEADRTLAAIGLEDPVALLDRMPTLLAAGLVDEARAAARRAAALLEGRGVSTYRADAARALADAELAAGNPAGAAAFADEAADRFAALGLSRRVLECRAIALLGRLQAGPAGAAVVRRAADLAAECSGHGLVARALDLHLAAGTAAAAAGDQATAGHELAAAARARAAPSVERRVRGWRAEAHRRLTTGDRRGAMRAVRAGLAALDRSARVLGAVELRAHLGSHGTELAALGLALASAGGRPRSLLAWGELHRARSLQRPPVRPPADERMAELLADLRAVSLALDEAVASGGPTAALQARRRRLEAAVSARARLAAGAEPALAPPPLDAVLAQLGERALVEVVAVGGRLVAVVAAGRRVTATPVGPPAAVDRELRLLRFALRRLAFRSGGAALLEAAADNAAYAAARVDDLLVGPVRRRVGDRPLVLVPTGALHAVPWGALPSLRARPFVVAPSAALWATAERRPPVDGHRLLVAGPGLAHATREVEQVAGRWPGARTLAGPAATTTAVVEGIDGAAVAHVCAHGRVRADQPLLSSLRLADGPLTVHDLERVRRAPGTLVLSACDTGLSAVRPGDELMGFVAAVLGLGARSVVASTGPLPDDTAVDVMVAMHEAAGQGAPPAEALAAARSAHADPTAAFLVAFGA